MKKDITLSEITRPIITLGLLFMLFGCSKEQSKGVPPLLEVEVSKPLVQEITEWDEYTGKLDAVETVEIRPRVSGYLQSINFTDGAIVQKGDLLFVIDPRPYLAVQNAAQAEVERITSQLELAKGNAGRAAQLIKDRAISSETLDTRSKTATQSEAALRAALATLDQAKLNVEFTELRAPISGRISRKLVTVGNLVNGGPGGEATLLTTIVSLDPIHCYFDVDEQAYLKYSRLAKSGERPSSREHANPVEISLADEKDFPHKGKMDFVDNRIDPLTGTMRGRAILENTDLTLIPGLFVKVRLPGSGKYSATLIPDKSLGNDQSNKIVFVVGQDNTVQPKVVTTGRMLNGLRIIRSGLNQDDRIALSGLQRLRPGTKIKPIEPTKPLAFISSSESTK